MKIYFTDFSTLNLNLAEYGAFNISLINDLPFLLTRFLLFGSKNPEYKNYTKIFKMLTFLKSKSEIGFKSIVK
jgi:hypothetical protein